ncbi:MAG: hypothetical protein AABX72_03020 [Nanoarchaeota archaeon]
MKEKSEKGSWSARYIGKQPESYEGTFKRPKSRSYEGTFKRPKSRSLSYHMTEEIEKIAEDLRKEWEEYDQKAKSA